LPPYLPFAILRHLDFISIRKISLILLVCDRNQGVVTQTDELIISGMGPKAISLRWNIFHDYENSSY
jgi:hypothetical protein